MPATTTATHKCACRCGQDCARTFLPGHDSILIAKLAASYEAGRISRAKAIKTARDISEALGNKMETRLEHATRND